MYYCNGRYYRDKVNKDCIEIKNPIILDYWLTRKKGTQSLLLKDIGFVLAISGVTDGWKVVEIGPGVGGLTLFLANAVKPSGKVIVYEKDKRWIPLLRENLQRAGLLDYVEIKHREIGKEDIDETDIDLIFIDVKNPIEVYEKVKDKLKKDRLIIIFTIHFEKVSQLLDVLPSDFYDVNAIKLGYELIEKTPNGTRFEISGVKFNGFLVWGRKK